MGRRYIALDADTSLNNNLKLNLNQVLIPDVSYSLESDLNAQFNFCVTDMFAAF